MRLFTVGGYILESEERKMSDNYCDNCKKNVPIWIRERTVTLKYGSSMTTYDEAYAICQFCGKEVYDPKVNGMNVERRAYVLSKVTDAN